MCRNTRNRGLVLAPPLQGVATIPAMKFFYGAMALLMAGTLLPSVFFLVLYMATGERVALVRAGKLWNFLRVFTLMGFNIALWGHLVVAAWELAH